MKRLAAVLCVVGAVVTVVAGGASWAQVASAPDPPLPGRVEDVDGLAVVPGIRVLALVAVAAVVAALAVRGWARYLVGLVILGCGAGIVVQVLRGRREDLLTSEASLVGNVSVDVTLWPWVAALGGLLVCAAGLVVLVGRHWSGLSSAYEPPAAQEPESMTSKGAWDALDRGEDPTR